MATSEPAPPWSIRTTLMTHRHGLRHGLLGLSLLLLLSAQTSLPRTEVWIARGDSQEEIARFAVEIADTPQIWEHGLMERASLAPNAGMLFVFSDVAFLFNETVTTVISTVSLLDDAPRRVLRVE